MDKQMNRQMNRWVGGQKKTNFMAPFHGWGSTASGLEPLRGGSLLFTTKFPEIQTDGRTKEVTYRDGFPPKNCQKDRRMNRRTDLTSYGRGSKKDLQNDEC